MPTLFSRDHLWIQAQHDGSRLAGISNHAQNALGDIVFVDFPAVGSHLTAGQACGVIESVKTASDLIAPMDGEVLEVNESLRDRPEQINDSPESAWIFRFRPADPSLAAHLLSQDAYDAWLET